MSRLRSELEIETKSAEQLRKRLSDKEKTLDEKKSEILDKARAEARDIVEDAKDFADSAIRDYNKWLNSPDKVDARKLEETRTGLRKKKDSYGSNDKKKEAPKISGQKAKDFHIGDKVLVLSINTEGHIIELPDAKGNALVEMGILTSRFNISDLLIIKEDKIKTKTADQIFRFANTGATGSGKAYSFKPEINLLGKTVDEALAELDKFLDDALLTHTETVRIVHGKGTGALRKAVTEYLKKKSFVKEFRLGEYGEGDSGVTVVKL